MNSIGKIYVSAVVVAGIVVTATGLTQWTSAEPGLFALLLSAAAVVSTLKVRLPGVWGNITPGSFFVLLGIGRFSLPEAITVGIVSALAQSLINTKKTPRPEQVAFNVATLAISAGAASFSSRLFTSLEDGFVGLLAGLVLAVQVYYLLNTSLVAGVISVTSGQQFSAVWRQCHTWNFLYFLVVVPMAGFAWYVLPAMNWRVFLLLAPTLLLLHKCYAHLLAGSGAFSQTADR